MSTENSLYMDAGTFITCVAKCGPTVKLVSSNTNVCDAYEVVAVQIRECAMSVPIFSFILSYDFIQNGQFATVTIPITPEKGKGVMVKSWKSRLSCSNIISPAKRQWTFRPKLLNISS